VDDGAVFGDDVLEEVEARERDRQVFEQPPRHEHDLAAGAANRFERGHRRRVDPAVAGERAVVVGGEDEVAHSVVGSAVAIGPAP
jgi:urease beta subunit